MRERAIEIRYGKVAVDIQYALETGVTQGQGAILKRVIDMNCPSSQQQKLLVSQLLSP